MPELVNRVVEFVNRVVEWFQARSTLQKTLIVIVVLVLLSVLSPATVLIAAAVLLASLVVVGIRMISRGPLRGPAIIAAVSLVAVGLFSGISSAIYGGDQPQDTADVERTEEPIAGPEPDPPQEPIADPEPEEQQEPEPEREPALEPPYDPEPITLRGVGLQTTAPFDLDEGLVILSMIHQGQGAFAVELLDRQSGELVDLPANVVGSFSGSSALGVQEGAYLLDVTADGPWSVTLTQPRPDDAPEITRFQGQAPTATQPFSFPGGPVRFEMSHNGEGDFTVSVLDSDSNMVALPANEIGNFQGSSAELLPRGIYVLDVDADGSWTIEIEP